MRLCDLVSSCLNEDSWFSRGWLFRTNGCRVSGHGNCTLSNHGERPMWQKLQQDFAFQKASHKNQTLKTDHDISSQAKHRVLGRWNTSPDPKWGKFSSFIRNVINVQPLQRLPEWQLWGTGVGEEKITARKKMAFAIPVPKRKASPTRRPSALVGLPSGLA